MHPKTVKLLKQHKTFWDALRGRLFPAEGAGTGTDTSSKEVTRTLNRIVYSVGDLTTVIGASDFMREEPKKKMLVKNSTTDMSDTTVRLLTAVLKHVIPNLPPPEQIHYKVNPASERRDRLNRFSGLTEGVLGVVGMVTQGTDIPPLNVLLNWEAPIGTPAKVIETYVYSRAHVQLVGRPCRKDPKNADKTCWYYCLPGVELEEEEIASKEHLVELLKTMASKAFGVYSTYSVFNKEHSNDGGVTFLVPAKRGLGGGGGDSGGSKQLQSGQVINEALTIELEAGDIENIRACIEAREAASFEDKLNAWKEEMEGRVWWQPHPTSRGAQPDNVILQTKKTNEEAKTPWRYKISMKVNKMLASAKTKQDWDHAANKDACTFHAFVSGKGGLGLQGCQVGGEEAQGRPEASKGN